MGVNGTYGVDSNLWLFGADLQIASSQSHPLGLSGADTMALPSSSATSPLCSYRVSLPVPSAPGKIITQTSAHCKPSQSSVRSEKTYRGEKPLPLTSWISVSRSPENGLDVWYGKAARVTWLWIRRAARALSGPCFEERSHQQRLLMEGRFLGRGGEGYWTVLLLGEKARNQLCQREESSELARDMLMIEESRPKVKFNMQRFTFQRGITLGVTLRHPFLPPS